MTTLHHRIPLSELPALPASGRHGLRVRARNPVGAGEPSTQLHARPVEGTEVQRSRVNGEWVDTGTLAVANALQILRARTTADEEETVSQGIRIDSLRAEVGVNLATAIDTLTARVDVNEDGIEVNADALTALMGSLNDYATATALNSLSTQLSQVDDRVTANASEISAVEAAFGARTLGPMQNVFTGADKAAAEAARDTYAAANPTWLADYDADNDINIELRWGVLYVYQRRLNGAWVDNGEALARAAAVTMLNAMVTDHDGELTALARWQVKTAVGDLVGGIGLLNDGTDVKLTIVADKVAILPASGSLSNRVVPFIISGGRVYIASAMIQDATITTAKIQNAFLTNLEAKHGTLDFARIGQGNIFDLTIGDRIQSDVFTSTTGFRFDANGNFVLRGGEFRGDLQSSNFSSGSTGWRLLNNGTFEVNGGTFRGDIQSDNFIAGSRGWRIQRSGGAEFDAAVIRGTLTVDQLDISGINAAITRQWTLLRSAAIELTSAAAGTAVSISESMASFDTLSFTVSYGVNNRIRYATSEVPRASIPSSSGIEIVSGLPGTGIVLWRTSNTNLRMRWFGDEEVTVRRIWGINT